MQLPAAAKHFFSSHIIKLSLVRNNDHVAGNLRCALIISYARAVQRDKSSLIDQFFGPNPALETLPVIFS